MNIGDSVSIEEIEKAHIIAVIQQAPNLGIASRILGIDPATLYRKRKRWGLDLHVELKNPTNQPGAEPSAESPGTNETDPRSEQAG
jgi:hypothetical protein